MRALMICLALAGCGNALAKAPECKGLNGTYLVTEVPRPGSTCEASERLVTMKKGWIPNLNGCEGRPVMSEDGCKIEYESTCPNGRVVAAFELRPNGSMAEGVLYGQTSDCKGMLDVTYVRQ